MTAALQSVRLQNIQSESSYKYLLSFDPSCCLCGLRVKSFWLREGLPCGLFQVLLFIPQIVLGILQDSLLRLFIVDLFLEFAWCTDPEGVRFDDRILGDHRASGDDAAFPHNSVVEDDGAHADETVVADGAAVQSHGVAHGDP